MLLDEGIELNCGLSLDPTGANQTYENDDNISNQNKFIDMLVNANFNRQTLSVLRKNHKEPRTIEVIAYLKLMKAFRVLKNRVVGESREDNNDDDATKLKVWQVFLTNSVRRFIVFVNAIYSQIKDETNSSVRVSNFKLLMKSLLPPLDVLLIWHTLLLNNNYLNDIMKRNNFTEFLEYPFPWQLINASIHNYSFEFLPSWNLQKTYTNLVYDGGYDIGNYHLDNSIFDQEVDIYCPNCCSLLVKDVDLTNKKNTGFADHGFSITLASQETDCLCGSLSKLDHDSLKKLQLYKDINDPRPLVGFLEVDVKTLLDMNALKKVLKFLLVENPGFTMKDIFKEAFQNFNDPISKTLFIKNYNKLNLIHCTIPKPDFQIHRDLVASTIREEQFMNDILYLKVLHDVNILKIIKGAKFRYNNFIILQRQFKDVLMYPTLEIDLMLKTEQLSNPGTAKTFYQKACTMFIQEDDLKDAFTEMLSKYHKNFDEYPLTCTCNQCQELNWSYRNSIKRIWKRKLSSVGSSIRRKSFDESFSKSNQTISLTHPSLNYCWFSDGTSSTGYKDSFIKKTIIYLDVYINSPFVSPIHI